MSRHQQGHQQWDNDDGNNWQVGDCCPASHMFCCCMLLALVCGTVVLCFEYSRCSKC
jgi:hypothetical protein